MLADLQALFREHKATFDRYAELLIRWNQKINLTAITDPAQIAELHFIDSLAVAAWLQKIVSREAIRSDRQSRILPKVRGRILSPPDHPHRESHFVSRETISMLDVGTGAGFPGLPIKIALPNLHVTLVDSVKKKCDFLKEVIRTLSLTNVHVIHDRLDGKKSIELFDFVISRAAFKIKELLALARPNLKPGGMIIAMKSMGIEEEIEEASSVFEKLSFSQMEFSAYELPNSRQKRQLVTVR